MAEGAIPSTQNDRVRVNSNDPGSGFLEDKLESTDSSVGIEANDCDDKVDLTVNGLGGFNFKWVKTTILFSDFNTVSFTVNFTPTEFTGLAAGSTPVYSKVKHSTSFTGGGVASCTIKLFYAGSAFGGNTNIFRATGATVGGTSVVTGNTAIMDHIATDDLEIELKTTGATADNLTAGTAELWVLIATLV